MLIKVPQDASSEMSEFCRQVNDMFDVLLGGRNVDLKGRRIINAGNAVDPQDYVTRADVVQILISAGLKVSVDGSTQQFAPAPRGAAAASGLAGDLARASLRP